MHPAMPPTTGPPARSPLRPAERLVPVRRLTPAECDLVGFAGPLVVSERELRWLGPWRRTARYVVVRHPDVVLMSCSRAELAALGVELDPGDDQPRRAWWEALARPFASRWGPARRREQGSSRGIDGERRA